MTPKNFVIFVVLIVFLILENNRNNPKPQKFNDESSFCDFLVTEIQ